MYSSALFPDSKDYPAFSADNFLLYFTTLKKGCSASQPLNAFLLMISSKRESCVELFSSASTIFFAV